MIVPQQLSHFDAEKMGSEMKALAERLFPICRSITGEGVRETLAIVRDRIPLEVHEVPSGTQVFDWEVPPEWNIREAWIKDSQGRKIADLGQCNLHLMSYSEPVRRKVDLAELKPHLHSLPEHPDWIPYRTSYYRRDWGFCLPHRTAQSLPEGEYDILIDSDLEPGSLTYGELLLPGASDREILFSTHVCHPSLANDNLSGIAIAVYLATALQSVRTRYSYRFLFIPGTIGSITWLARNEDKTDRIHGGLVLANLGDQGGFHYKRSRQGESELDRAVLAALRDQEPDHRVEDFVPYGYDERQYCSPGFDLAVGSLTRTPYGRYPEYHTSADNLEFLSEDSLAGSLKLYLAVVETLETNRRFQNLSPRCEPQLGKRGLYGSVGGAQQSKDGQLALLWVLNLSDGEHDLIAIAERSGLPFALVSEAAEKLVEAGLLGDLNG